MLLCFHPKGLVMARVSPGVIVFLMLAVSLHLRQEDDLSDKYKKEIEAAEREFAEYARNHSVRDAFLAFAAPNAVLLRGGQLVEGRGKIGEYFDNSELKEMRLSWKPDFVDVSKSGDMGYTYGKFSLSAKDAQGKDVRSEGVFHTVWKRQPDGTWKFVWD